MHYSPIISTLLLGLTVVGAIPNQYSRNDYIKTTVEKATTIQLVPPAEKAGTSFIEPLTKSFAIGTRGEIKLYGCTVVQVVSDTDSYTAHLWEGDMENETDFKTKILGFLEEGAGAFPGLAKNKEKFANGRAYVFAFTKGPQGKTPLYRAKVPKIVEKVEALVGCPVMQEVYYGTDENPAEYLGEYDHDGKEFRAFVGTKDIAPFKAGA